MITSDAPRELFARNEHNQYVAARHPAACSVDGMADTDDEVAAPSVPPRTPTTADLKPGTRAWRVNVAMCAHQFFNVVHDPEVAKAIGNSIPSTNAATADGPPKTLPFDPWSVLDFSRYLGALGLPGANNAIALTKLLGSLERAGLLVAGGTRSSAANHGRALRFAGSNIEGATWRKAEMPEGKALTRLAGMAFRDPDWADEVYVFGYPRVPMTGEMAITVQRGEVVNPVAETIPDRQKIFLYSAIARPGNSGGPIVAQDGRVIALVVEDSAESPSTDAGPAGAPFYRGIPSSEVIRALDDLGFGGIVEIDTLP